MWTVDDVWKVWDFLKSGLTFSDQLDANLVSIAKSSKDKSTTFFENVVDQYCFLSPDYNRLKEMWIDWYSTFRTFSIAERESSDPFSMTEANLVQLMMSFGYRYYVEALSFNTKVNFFLDLVNLYKLKGTPFALDRVLAFFGLSDISLVEYWLQKKIDHPNDLIFFPQESIPDYVPPVEAEIPSIPFNDMIFDDPHWFSTRQQILDSFEANDTNLPSRSPYFGINGYFNMDILEKCIAILERKIQDDYNTWKTTGMTSQEVELKKLLGGKYRAQVLQEEIQLKKISGFISVMETYLGVCYLFDNVFGSAHGTGPWFLCYNLNSPDATNYNAIEVLWETLTTRPVDRFDREVKLENFYTSFARPAAQNFMSVYQDVVDKLTAINPILKAELDSWLAADTGAVLLAYFLNELGNWIETNIDPSTPNIMILMLGIGAYSDLFKVINFFKPYRARLHRLNFVLYFRNKMRDSFFASEKLYENILETIVDWDTADSYPGYLESWPGPDDVIVRSNPPLGAHRIHNLYVTPAGLVKAVYSDATAVYSSTIISQPPVGNHRVLNVYLGDDIGGKKLYVEYNDVAEAIFSDSTIVVSNPTAGYYVILEMHITSALIVSITYETPARVFPVDSTARVYYSRNTYDAGSFFDIGASTDFSVDNPDGLHTFIYEYIYDIYNAHPPDATSYVGWGFVVDSTSLEPIIYTYGGFVDFDEGWIFDSPFNNDVCMIYVEELPGPPEILLAPSSILFTLSPDSTADSTFDISNIGEGTLNWNITIDSTGPVFVVLSNYMGSGDTTITVTANSSGLSAGTYTNYIVVSDPSATNSPQTVTVTLEVSAPIAPVPIPLMLMPAVSGDDGHFYDDYTGLAAISVGAPGAGYNDGDILTLSGPGPGSGGTALVTTDGMGGVIDVAVVTRGTGFTTGVYNTTVAPPGGLGCTVSVDAIINFFNVVQDVIVGNTSGSLFDFFIRFPNATIPNGATIVSAFVRFTASFSNSQNTCNVNCYFNDVDNAVAPIDSASAVALSLTPAVAWNAIGAWVSGQLYDSVELKTILQDVVNRPGWVSGNALQIVFKNNGSSNNARRRAHTVDVFGDMADLAELHISYY